MRIRSTRRGFLRTGLGLAAARVAGADEPPAWDIEAAEDWLTVGGRAALLYGYNRQVPGPVIETVAGAEVRISFRNRLAEASNLHFHGLHVPPTGSADNVMMRAEPGESIDYRFTIPGNHPSGTFWYHPHVFGSAARQLSRGLAGAIIVRNPAEAIPEIDATPERILVLQDFAIDGAGHVIEPNMMDRMNGREGSLVTVSGSAAPDLTVARDGWLRLRIINASSSRFHRLRLDEHPLYLIATDGGLLPAVEPREELLLTPGERAEVMIRGERPPGEYRLMNLPYDRGTSRPAGTPLPPAAMIVRLVYGGQAEMSWNLPESLNSVDPLGPAVTRRVFSLSQGFGMAFTINGRTFNQSRVDVRTRLDTVEDWEFANQTAMDHPMHIHTDAFQVLDSDGNPIPAWKDTVLVKGRARLTVRTRTRDYPGMRMFHCHVLDHEDLGMMAMLEAEE